MARYAENTQVSSEASRAEIERTLRRYGASEFAYGWDEFLAHVLLPNGTTVGEWASPQLEVAYAGHSMPTLLPGASS